MKSRILFRWLLGTYARATIATLALTSLLFVLFDFVDHLNAFAGKPTALVAELYANKSVLIIADLLPTALILAACLVAGELLRRGEWTALQALGCGRRSVLVPLIVVGALMALASWAIAERGVSRAGPRVDQMLVGNFSRWGDYRFFYFPQRWRRTADGFLFVEGERSADGKVLQGVMVLSTSPGKVERRLDARTLTYVSGYNWRAEDVWTRSFSEPESYSHEPERIIELPPLTPENFTAALGRFEHFPYSTLRTELARNDHRPSERAHLRYVLGQRYAQPFAAIVGAVLAVLLVLRGNRSRGQSLATGIAVIALLHASALVAKSIALGGHLQPEVAGILPLVLLGAAVLLLLLRGRRVQTLSSAAR